MLRRGPVLLVSSVLALAFLSPAHLIVSAQQPVLPDVLAKAAQYVAAFADPGRVLLCEEHGAQTFVRLKVNAAGRVETQPVGSRTWVGEMAIMASPGNEKTGFPWVEYRDVLSLDGKSVHEKSRLAGLSTQPLAQAMQEAETATREAMETRLGLFLRAGLLPRAALVFLHPSNQPRFDFKKGGEKTIEGVKTWEVRYQEKARPTIFMAGETPAPCTGSFWIDPATGHVLATLLKNSDPAILSDEQSVNYKLNQATGLWLPAQLIEKMSDDADEPSRVDGTITFTNWHAVPRKTS
jgi:hypothetical protein